MLARLNQEPGIEHAQVDRRGELLHLRLVSGDLVDRAVTLLNELGFAGEPMSASPAAAHWYGTEDVGALSREEAEVIAARVVPPFAAAHSIGEAGVDELRDLVATALHGWFTRHTAGSESLGSFHRACAQAVATATRERLGGDASARLGSAVEADFAAR